MESTCSSETSVDFQRTTWRYIPDDRTLHDHRCDNLKFCKGSFKHFMFRQENEFLKKQAEYLRAFSLSCVWILNKDNIYTTCKKMAGLCAHYESVCLHVCETGCPLSDFELTDCHYTRYERYVIRDHSSLSRFSFHGNNMAGMRTCGWVGSDTRYMSLKLCVVTGIRLTCNFWWDNIFVQYKEQNDGCTKYVSSFPFLSVYNEPFGLEVDDKYIYNFLLNIIQMLRIWRQCINLRLCPT
jgi:hypothetical protein